MKATVKWEGPGGMALEARADSGHTVIMDVSPEAGGQNKGFRPMEMMLLGMGGCTSFDVISILQKGREDVTNCVAQMEATRADDVPKVFTKIHIHFVVTGRALSAAKVERAIELSANKYCSASIMIGKTAEITHDFEIVETT